MTLSSYLPQLAYCFVDIRYLATVRNTDTKKGHVRHKKYSIKIFIIDIRHVNLIMH